MIETMLGIYGAVVVLMLGSMVASSLQVTHRTNSIPKVIGSALWIALLWPVWLIKSLFVKEG